MSTPPLLGLLSTLVDRGSIYIRVLQTGDDVWGGKALVLSRIGIHKTRQGYRIVLLKLLVSFASEQQYNVIGIEQASSPSIQAFAYSIAWKVPNTSPLSLIS